MSNTNAVTINGSGKITACINGTIFTIDPTHSNYQKALEAIKAHDYDAFLDQVDLTRKIRDFMHQHGQDTIKIVDGSITWNDEVIHNTLTKRVISFMQQDLPFKPLLNFLGNLMQNPSKRAVDELYDFLEVGELPITEDGCFLAFKNVKSDYKDIHSGTFDNSVGKVCEVRRNQVDEDKDRTCSYGLHFCSIAYLPHFRDSSGGKTMILKINPSDVVAIPADYNNTKGRCCKYEVIGEYTDDWRSRLDRGENGFDSDLYSSDGGEYEDDDSYDCDPENEEEGLGSCSSCSLDLTNENYNGNGDNLCDNCYDDHYSGCYGGGCAGKTTNEDQVGNEGNDGCCGGQCGCDNQYGKKPDGSLYHNLRDALGKFVKKNVG
jgi:hypothetical protein